MNLSSSRRYARYLPSVIARITAGQEAPSDAIRAPLAGAISLQAQVSRQVDSTAVQLQREPNGFAFEENNGRWRDALEITGRFAKPDGNQVSQLLSKTLDQKLLSANHDKIARRGVNNKETFRVPSQSERLRVLVRDGNSGQIGTVTIPLTSVKDAQK